MSNPAPVVGKWYARPGGDSFEVVAIDGVVGNSSITNTGPTAKGFKTYYADANGNWFTW